MPTAAPPPLIPAPARGRENGFPPPWRGGREGEGGDQIGFLTKRAGVSVDLDTFNEAMFTGAEAAEEGARILAGLEKTTASERDVPLLLSALLFLGKAKVDEKKKTVSYEEKDLVSLAAFSALRNPAVERKEILYERRKKPTPDPDRGSPASPLGDGGGGTHQASSPPRAESRSGDPVSGRHEQGDESGKSPRNQILDSRLRVLREAGMTDQKMLLLIRTAEILSKMGYPRIGQALVVKGAEVIDRLPLRELVKNLYRLADQQGPGGRSLRTALDRVKKEGRLLPLAIALRMIAKKQDAMEKLATYLGLPPSSLPASGIPGVFLAVPPASLPLRPVLPVH